MVDVTVLCVLQGVNFQLSAVLLSLGAYTYVEYCESVPAIAKFCWLLKCYQLT